MYRTPDDEFRRKHDIPDLADPLLIVSTSILAAIRPIADQFRPKLPKLAGFLDEAETDVLAYMTFQPQHRTNLHSTNAIERLNGEIKRRTEVVGTFPSEDAMVRLIGATCSNRTTNDRPACPLHDTGNHRALER